jgi:hypothetical protein
MNQFSAGRDAVGPEPELRHPAEALQRRRVRLRRLVQPQETSAAEARPLRPDERPVVGRRGQQVPQRAVDAWDAADQPVPAVQDEGHPPPRPVLRIAATRRCNNRLVSLSAAQSVTQV